MKTELPNVIIANLHRRHTGVSSTVKDLIPHQEKMMDVGIADWGDLNRGQSKFSILSLIIKGFSKPNGIARYRVLHARRAIDMVLGIFLRDILGQKWKIVFTSATNHHHSRMFLKLLGKMDALIATSSFIYNFLDRDKFSAEIHHGIDTTRYFPDPKLSESKNSGEGDWIGCVGRVRHAKGVDLFVDTMLKVLPEQENYKAKIIGLCKPRDEKFKQHLLTIIKQADLQDKIVFSGEIGTEGMDELYRSMVLCIACSRSEGFGLVPFEALATGTPVVTSMTGAWPILIGKDIGRVVEIDNSEEMIKATKELLSNGELRKTMCKKAREQAVSKFHISNEARGINRVYTSLLY
ncbi:MAG: glycosyltransferase family 4 protein [Paracoccaceae bacterium]|nr:glycosyltransferase family 4 protein [Paracoccaceae bacterium]MDE2674345.1 glycosyltransferase family 4 protein [Paracoccaceae bacterium]MXZ50755.1 glycosyltransferase family 4 protein [Paracoccaceae bacterium]MYF46224.1 glycosyltransferase family 4 protein [Paracoccaceae bacterium]MYI90474.1 glycosyltransferase family 4 protein [Paracoccaceae bacterium]